MVHGQVVASVVLTHRMHTHNARVFQLGHDPGLVVEPGHEVLIPGQLLRKHLHRVALLQVHVLGKVHLAHAAFADGLQDAVVAELLAY